MSGYSDISAKLENSRTGILIQHPYNRIQFNYSSKKGHGSDVLGEDKRNCLRRIARHDERQFSKDSLVHVMEKFVKTVNVMDETILIPCRLMDRQVGDSTDTIPVPPKTSSHFSHHHNHHHHSGAGGGGGCRKNRNPQHVHEFLSSADLFNLYNLLNSLKNDLLWTRNDEDNEEANHYENELAETVSQATLGGENENSAAATNNTNQEPQQNSTPMKPQHKRNASNASTASSSSTASLSSAAPATTATTTSSSTKGHARRPSTASMVSSNSVSNLSDSESEISNENDSGMESEGICRTGGGSTTSDSSNSTNNTDKATDLVRQCRQHLSGLYRCLEQMTEAANYLTARYQSDIGPV